MVQYIIPQVGSTSKEFRISRLDGGLCVKYNEMQIRDNQSPYILNLNADDKGALTKRKGQAVFHTFSEGPVHRKIRYDGKWVVAHGTKLSTYDGETETPILTGLANAKGVFFIMNDILYYMNGKNYVQYNGSTAGEVVGKIPTIATATPPAGGGTDLEDFNLIQPGFKQIFSGDGTSTEYYLRIGGLDATPVSVSVNGVELTEDTHFTVNRTTGLVDFSDGSTPHGAPAEGTVNVEITAYKTNPGAADKIKKCNIAILYGGENDTRVFIAGPDNMYYYCDVYDPTMWPENNFNQLGGSDEKITAFAVVYDALVTFKERSVYYTYFRLEDTGASFPTRPLNYNIGCDMPNTLQLIHNNPVWCTTYAGPMILTNTNIRDERNIRPIGANINGAEFRPGLLDEDINDLKAATSLDHNNKYYLCVGDKVWVWDYGLTPYYSTGNPEEDAERIAWFYYDNINANCWYEHDRTVYYGDRKTGAMVNFISNYNDFGEAINGVWRSKLMDFNFPDWLKTIFEIWLTTRAGQRAEVNIIYYSDNGEAADTATISKASTSSFDWANFAWDIFTWYVAKYASTFKRKPKIKKVKYFQIEISNNEVNQNLSLMNLVIKYSFMQKVK